MFDHILLNQKIQAGNEGRNTKCLWWSIHSVPSLKGAAGLSEVQTCILPSGFQGSKEFMMHSGSFVTTMVAKEFMMSGSFVTTIASFSHFLISTLAPSPSPPPENQLGFPNSSRGFRVSRVWGTKPSPAGIKASIQESVCSHSNRFHSSLAFFPDSQGRPAGPHLPTLAPHIRALPKGRWPQTQGLAHFFSS